MKTFYTIIWNTLAVSVTNFFVWFATTFWLYIQTQSVLATSISSAVFMAIMAVSGFWPGSIVDHYRKKKVILIATAISIVSFVAALIVYLTAPEGAFTTIASPYP